VSSLEFYYLKQEDLVKIGVLDISKAIEDVEVAFKALAEGRIVNPPKTVLDFYETGGSYKGHIVSMPVHALSPYNVACIKWAAGFVRNPQRGLPHGIDVIVISDLETGKPPSDNGRNSYHRG